ncbi:autotransporter outer membrane beta-barrel domain-containing protein [Variovorax sp. RCC_210]|uniref:autotransporter outer membrane beta-barrel domain-containing protein n=1 Tax=Variovorax sp. RCC_210 TaxID=3239217 RepID=UPI0035254C3A
MNKIFRTLWNPTLGTWVAAPEISRGHARSSSKSSSGTRAVAMAVALVCAGPALAAGGAGGQPVGEPMLHAGAGGSDGNGGSGGLNDSMVGASGGNGGASTPAGVLAGSDAVKGTFTNATPGTGGAAGTTSTAVSPGVFQGDNGAVGQSQTGGFGAGDGYGGGGGGGFQGATIPTNATSSTDSYTGGNGGAGGQGYWAAGGGGAGGYGAILNGALANFTHSGPAVGGVGGAGGDAYSQGGGGGSGGGGFYLNAAAQGLTFTNLCLIAGGAGGVGGAGGTTLTPAQLNASGGGGGAGGIGLTLAGSAITVNNAARILGGAGGAGGDGGGGATGNGAPGAGGDGGIGLSSQGAGGAVSNTGTIAGGAGGVGGVGNNGGAPGTTGATGAGGVGLLGSNLAVTNSGTIAGGMGGDGVTRASAVEFTGGANSLTLQTGAVLTGAIAIDPGATASVIAGSDGLTVGNALLLGGTGTIDTNGNNLSWTGPISGAADLIKAGAGVLTVSGANTNSGATSVAAGTLRAGATNTFSNASAFNVANGATLDLAGFSQTVASLTNSGTVSLVGTVPGTTLTVNGPWVGNGGTLRLGTALGTSTSVSDRLVLSGATAIASGTTNVQIVNLGGLGGLTAGNGIEVISAINGATTSAQTTRSAFTLAGGHVDAGAYQYRLYAADASGAGENWYLRSTATVTPPGGGTGTGTGTDPGTPLGAGTGTGAGAGAGTGTGTGTGFGGIVVPTYRNEVALYAALPEQVRQAGLAMLGNLHQRVGDDGASGANTASPDQGYRQAWGRVISTDRTIGQSGTVSPTSEGRLTGFQAGTDLWADPNWRVGVYVGQLDGTMSVTGFAGGLQNYGVGSTDLRNQFLGAYATWKNDSGLYVDGVLQAGRHRYTALPTLGFASSGKGNSLLASIEVGQSFPLAENWSIEPQLQLVHQRVNLDDTGIVGALVQQNSHDGWLLRAGVRVKGEIATSAGLLQPYVRVNVYRSGSGSDVTRFVGPAAYTDIATATGGTSTELAGGATLHLTQSTSLYAELGKLWSSSGDARIKSGVNASVGVKVRW